jgi:hypothetical protein
MICVSAALRLCAAVPRSVPRVAEVTSAYPHDTR